MTSLQAAPTPLQNLPDFMRAQGVLRTDFALDARGRTHVARHHEAGGLRLRVPRFTHGCEGVIVNSAGGIAGGDTLQIALTCAAKTHVTITTQSAEKIYRSDDLAAVQSTTLALGDGARLDYIPQETILFDRAHFRRRIDADLTGNASLLTAEILVFGRAAMGENCTHGLFRDSWRLRRDGKLVFADEVMLGPNPAALLDRPAIGNNARALATLIIFAPDAERHLALIRDHLAARQIEGGASLLDGLLVARMAALSPEPLRAVMLGLLAAVRRCAAPRVWQ